VVWWQPLLWKLLDGGRGGRVFIAALVQCSLCFFMFSWHVHEKAVLMPILLLTYRLPCTYLCSSFVRHT
jgi:hypothetical protein